MDQNLTFKLNSQYIGQAKKLYSELPKVKNDNGLSTFVYVRTYSRNIYDENGNFLKNESFFETCLRCVNGIYSLAKNRFIGQWNDQHWQKEAFNMFCYFLQKKLLPPGRGLWALGTELVHTKNIGLSLFNCTFITSKNIDIVKAEFFCYVMDCLMVGVGVGFDSLGNGKIIITAPEPANYGPYLNVKPLYSQLNSMIPSSKKITPNGKKYLELELEYIDNVTTYHYNNYVIYKIPDTREGWVEAMRQLINSYFGKNYITLFDYSGIRPKGVFLKTFGGKASGPQPLAEGIAIIRQLLQKYIDKPVDSLIIVDICNIIAMIVVAGNVRRSSEIFLFDNPEMADIKKMFEPILDESNGQYWKCIYNASEEFIKTLPIDDPTIVINKNTIESSTLFNNIDEFIFDQKKYKIYPKLQVFKKYEYRTMREGWSNNSNNSLIVDYNWTDEEYGHILDKILPIIDATSEPGIFNRELSRHYGRICDGYGDHDLNVDGENPCGEITLQGTSKIASDKPNSAGGELCCLAEIIRSNIEDPEEFYKICYYATFLAKMVSTVPIHWKATHEIQHKNHRLGVSQTGIIEYLAKIGYDLKRYKEECKIGYKAVRRADDEISELFNLPRSIKVTTVKPSGTLSLVARTSSGMHAVRSQYYIRRVRMSKSETKLIDILTKLGYHIEDDVTQSLTTVVISFPIEYTKGIRTKRDFTIEEQFRLLVILQKYWSDNAVSCTLEYKDGQLLELKELLIKYKNVLKGASFSKFFDAKDTQYAQLPQEEITEEQYLEMSKNLTPFTETDILPDSEHFEEEQDNYCDGDKCYIKKN